jgi:hypothetical protein
MIAFAVLTCLVSVTSATADTSGLGPERTVYDDFNGTSVDTTKWNVAGESALASVANSSVTATGPYVDFTDSAHHYH